MWPPGGIPRFKIARWSDNELVLFDATRHESWLLYPPRSRYEFLRRQTADTTLVVHHPWAPYSRETEHAIRLRTDVASMASSARRRKRCRRRSIRDSIHFVELRRFSLSRQSTCPALVRGYPALLAEPARGPLAAERADERMRFSVLRSPGVGSARQGSRLTYRPSSLESAARD